MEIERNRRCRRLACVATVTRSARALHAHYPCYPLRRDLGWIGPDRWSGRPGAGQVGVGQRDAVPLARVRRGLPR